MSLLDVAPIIEQMLLISDNVSDLNFSTGQKPQIEISGSLYGASPLGLGKLTGFQTEILIFSPDFAAEFGGAAILQQKVNAMYWSERRRLFFVSVEENGTTLNAHDAFLRNLNLIVNANDINQLPLILNRALRDFNELYLYYNKAVGVMEI